MKHSKYRAAVISAAGLLAISGGLAAARTHQQAAHAQAILLSPAKPTIPQITPFERNPFIFTNWQQAGAALDSPDILQRRSGIEWLGQWTDTYATYGVAQDKANCDMLQGQKSLVPGLARAVREMPDSDSQQAARLLVLIGPSAQSALTAVCAALVTQGSEGVFKRYEMLNDLVHLCGGPSTVAPKLTALMQASDPETRRAAAGAAGFCDDIGFNHIGPPPEGADVLSASKNDAENIAFRALVIPVLAARVGDAVTSVRLAALTSLESLTYDSANAPWKTTLPRLSDAVSSPEPTVRLAALRVIAYMPADVSPLALSLRSGLHSGQEERSYALAALSHSAQIDRTATVTAFLSGMSSSNTLTRRQAASDINTATIPLWGGNFAEGPALLTNWWNDSRLFAVFVVPGLTQSQRAEELKKRQLSAEASQPMLLDALVKATSDPDHNVRINAAASLEQIGMWMNKWLGFGGIPNPAVQSRTRVEQAVTEAVTSLQATEPAEAQKLQDLNMEVVRGPMVVE